LPFGFVSGSFSCSCLVLFLSYSHSVFRFPFLFFSPPRSSPSCVALVFFFSFMELLFPFLRSKKLAAFFLFSASCPHPSPRFFPLLFFPLIYSQCALRSCDGPPLMMLFFFFYFPLSLPPPSDTCLPYSLCLCFYPFFLVRFVSFFHCLLQWIRFSPPNASRASPATFSFLPLFFPPSLPPAETPKLLWSCIPWPVPPPLLQSWLFLLFEFSRRSKTPLFFFSRWTPPRCPFTITWCFKSRRLPLPHPLTLSLCVFLSLWKSQTHPYY